MILQNWWFTTLMGVNSPIQRPLVGDQKFDFVVVGAGAAGLSAAYALAGKGFRVALVERNICGGSSSGKSAGFLTPDSELELSQLLRRFGKKGAQDLWAVATRGVQMMAERIQQHQINCDFQVQDCLFLGIGNEGKKEIEEEVSARQTLDFRQQQYNEESVRQVLSSSAYSGAVRYGHTYGVNALLYCQGMKQCLLDQGVAVFESSEVLSLTDHTVYTHLGSVTANQIIFCIDKISPSLSPLARNLYHAQTFLSISEPLTDQMVASVFPSERFQCWDSDLVYTYFRLTGDNRLLLGGGSMLTTFSVNDVNSSRVIDHVIEKFKHKFPQLKRLRFIQYWPGRIDTTRDLIPTIARVEGMEHVQFVLGCVGLPWATFCGDFAARHAADSPSCNDHHYYHYFRPDRHFLLPVWAERIMGKQLVFSINNGWAKYYQVDDVVEQ